MAMPQALPQPRGGASRLARCHVAARSNPSWMWHRIRSTGRRARSAAAVPSRSKTAHSARMRSRPNSSAMSSNSPNLGRRNAARMCAESPTFGLDQINRRRVCQNWLLLVLTAPTYLRPAAPAMLLSRQKKPCFQSTSVRRADDFRYHRWRCRDAADHARAT